MATAKTAQQAHGALRHQEPQQQPTPLVVDLNGTLIKTDSLLELFIVGLLRKPLSTLSCLGALLRGRGAFKRKVAEVGALSVAALPLREDFVTFLREQQRAGRTLHLVTSADQSVATAMSQRLSSFASAKGSREGLNLKGRNKARALRDSFPNGFAYAGDSGSDLEVWKSARSIVLVGVSPSTRRAAQRLGVVIEREFLGEQPALHDWAKALRLHQWAKNLLLFVPLILAHMYDDPVAVLRVTAAFLVMGLVASSTYLINDLSDLESDRRHDSKRARPIARGVIGAGNALAASLLLCTIGLLGAALISPRFLLLVCIYLGLTLAYSMRLKRIAMLDVLILGALYTLRVFMGTIVLGIAMSPWLLMFSLFFFLSMSLAKRHVEIMRAAAKFPCQRADQRARLQTLGRATDIGVRGGDRNLRYPHLDPLCSERCLSGRGLPLAAMAVAVGPHRHAVDDADLAVVAPRRVGRRSGGIRHQGSAELVPWPPRPWHHAARHPVTAFIPSRRFASWGRVSRPEHRIAVPAYRDALAGLVQGRRDSKVLAVGLGRSYGDTALNAGGDLIDMTRLNRVIALDTERGVLKAEAGLSVNDALQLIVPKGWFFKTTPGTRLVTLGGMVANDVHGKNHHRVGSFGCSVTELELLRSDAAVRRLSSRDNMRLFAATIGGLGLTGLISDRRGRAGEDWQCLPRRRAAAVRKRHRVSRARRCERRHA